MERLPPRDSSTKYHGVGMKKITRTTKYSATFHQFENNNSVWYDVPAQKTALHNDADSSVMASWLNMANQWMWKQTAKNITFFLKHFWNYMKFKKQLVRKKGFYLPIKTWKVLNIYIFYRYGDCLRYESVWDTSSKCAF